LFFIGRRFFNRAVFGNSLFLSSARREPFLRPGLRDEQRRRAVAAKTGGRPPDR